VALAASATDGCFLAIFPAAADAALDAVAGRVVFAAVLGAAGLPGVDAAGVGVVATGAGALPAPYM
jgi:hypothetical protein